MLAFHERLVGVGVAMPNDIHAWSTELGLRPKDMEGWEEDVSEAFCDLVASPVTVFDDATAACAAEMMVAPKSGHKQSWS